MRGLMMRGLLLKDRPWLLAFGVLGLAGLVAALLEHRFLGAYVMSPGRYEALFHVSWALGLLLGAVAGGFDEALGTRELLRQRPVTHRDVTRARQLGCATVLAGWFALHPVAGNLAYLVSDLDYTFGIWHSVPRHSVTMTVAVSACGVGLFAVALPLSWWARLLWAGVALLAVHSLGFWLTQVDRRISAHGLFSVWHVGAGLAFAWLGGRAAQHVRDDDLPWTAAARRDLLPPLLVLGLLVWCPWLAMLAERGLHSLARAYPVVFERDGRIELGVREGFFTSLHVVDREHRRTGETVTGKVRELEPEDLLGERQPWRPGRDLDFLRFESPWWRPGLAAGGFVRVGLVVDGPRRVFVRDPRGHGVQALDVSALHPPLSDDWSLGNLGDQVDPIVIVGDRGSRMLWRFDPATRTLAPWPLPDGDRYVASGYEARDVATEDGRKLDAAELRGAVVGERAIYRLAAGELRAFAKPAPSQPRGPDRRAVRRHDDTLLSWTDVVDRGEGAPPFRHEFTPRTALEWAYAALAVVAAALRPPLLQTLAAALDAVDAPWTWALDPLVARGSRWWLVGASWLVAALSALLARAALVRLGVGLGARRLWLALTLLLGPFGWFAAVLVERRRAHARHDLPAPVPARIITPAARS